VSSPAPGRPASFARRLASALYDLLLNVAIAMIATFPFLLVFGDATHGWKRHLLQAWVVAVIGFYYVWFWVRGGQTLPMKTWRLRLVTVETGEPPKALRAVARYLAAWLWFLPPLALHPLLHLPVPATLAATVAWFALWTAAARLDPARQFPHDRLAGTRIVAVERG